MSDNTSIINTSSLEGKMLKRKIKDEETTIANNASCTNAKKQKNDIMITRNKIEPSTSSPTTRHSDFDDNISLSQPIEPSTLSPTTRHSDFDDNISLSQPTPGCSHQSELEGTSVISTYSTVRTLDKGVNFGEKPKRVYTWSVKTAYTTPDHPVDYLVLHDVVPSSLTDDLYGLENFEKMDIDSQD